MQVKAKPWRWGRAKAKLAGCFKKVKWGCPPSLATRELVAAWVTVWERERKHPASH